MYSGYTITDFLDWYIERETKIAIENIPTHLTEMYSGYIYVGIFEVAGRLKTSYNVNVT